MSDLADRKYYTSDFIGLTTNAYILCAGGFVCIVFYEFARHVHRLPRWRLAWGEAPAPAKAGVGSGSGGDMPPEGPAVAWDSATGQTTYASRPHRSPEEWEMAHLYTPREFHPTTPTPPLTRWPLWWAWGALRLSDWWYATHVGLDAAVYVRFLRAATWWMLLQLLTTTPVLLAIHMRFSVCESRTDMACASLASVVTSQADPARCTQSHDRGGGCTLVNNNAGRRWLWVHLLAMYWLTLTWLGALVWVAAGAIRIRRKLILGIRTRTVHGRKAGRRRQPPAASGNHTILNLFPNPPAQHQHQQQQQRRPPLHPTVPATSRGPEDAAAALDELDRLEGRAANGSHPFFSARAAAADPELAGWRQRTLMFTNLPKRLRNQKVLICALERQLGLVGEANADDDDGNDPFAGSSDPFLPSPVQHVELVRKMAGLNSLVERRDAALAKLEVAHLELAQNVLVALGNKEKDGAFVVEKTPDDLVLAQHLAQYVKVPPHRLGRRSTDPTMAKSSAQRVGDSSFWHDLSSLPRTLLDPYQPTTRIGAGPYKGEVVPTVDLLLTKLNLLTALVDAARQLPESEWDPTPVAFVTFRDPRQARLVWRELADQVAPRVHLAPERRDLIWDRLMHTTYAARVVRSAGVGGFFWLFTVFWMIPTQAAASVLTNIGGITHVARTNSHVFDNHNEWLRFVSSTLPTLLVSGIMLLVPEFIFQVHLRAHRFLTRTELYDQCLCRYWKFVVCNTVILFSVGSATLETILVRVGSHHQGSVLTTIAFAFPSAAPFFCSYLMLNILTHSGAELVQAVIGLIQAVQAMHSRSPRDRQLKVLPRKFGHAIWMPLHLTTLTIVFIFAIFNPLVVCFAMVYLWCAL